MKMSRRRGPLISRTIAALTPHIVLHIRRIAMAASVLEAGVALRTGCLVQAVMVRFSFKELGFSFAEMLYCHKGVLKRNASSCLT